MFGVVVATEAHLALSGARTHSNNTEEMTVMIEALAFLGPRDLISLLGPRDPVARGANSGIYSDSKHAAGVCLGTIQARTCSAGTCIVSSRC